MVSNHPLSIVERWAKDHSPEGSDYSWDLITEEISMDVLEQTIEILKEREKNQSWLAQQMGVHRARISYLFTARPNMQLETIGRIASALKVRPKLILDVSRFHITPRLLSNGEDFENDRTDDALRANRRLKPINVSVTGTTANMEPKEPYATTI